MTVTFDGGPVQITSPVAGSAGPCTVAIASDCTVQVSVTTDPNLVRQLNTLSWTLNSGSGSPTVTGVAPGATIAFSAGPAFTDVPNTISVTINYVDNNGNTQNSPPVTRTFNATCSGSSCLSTFPGSEQSTNSPIAVPLPRFYKLALFGGSSHGQASTDNLLFGGLLQRSAVYLEYDVGLSTPTLAVWKDINLPDPIGKWTLRVCRKGGRLTGELTLFRLTQSEVAPPSIFGASAWNVRGDNVLRFTGQPGSFVDFSALHDLIVVVCPA